jgi:hypothetical protein
MLRSNCGHYKHKHPDDHDFQLDETMGFYVETSETESRDALDKLIGLVK